MTLKSSHPKLVQCLRRDYGASNKAKSVFLQIYEGWNFNSGNYLFTTDTK